MMVIRSVVGIWQKSSIGNGDYVMIVIIRNIWVCVRQFVLLFGEYELIWLNEIGNCLKL
jgi:hypothetical protein